MTNIDEYWKKFIAETGRSEEDRCAGDLSFEAKGFVGDELITLVLTNQEPLPVSGELYVVLDRANNPRCVIETQSVEIVPFNEVTWEMARLEGEDEDLGQWKERKQEYLEDEGAVLGFEFTPDIKLVYQTFKVVYQ